MNNTNPMEFESTIPLFSGADFEYIVPHEIRDLKRFGREEVFILSVQYLILHCIADLPQRRRQLSQMYGNYVNAVISLQHLLIRP